ncbi:MAG: hypothetical protein SCK57_07615 [Bacillota bacterium]|nr:hypothetical protein [Bacillota bacterium]MDW7677513.1 hypothetical protein [Bacillota bacterium]
MMILTNTLKRLLRNKVSLLLVLVIPPAMLGGLLWPREIMPQILQHIGMFLPTTWMMEAVNKVMITGRFLDAGWEVAILLLFSLVFFLMGSWRRVDISV